MIFPPLSHSTLQVKAGTYFSIHYRGPLNEKSGPLCLCASSAERDYCCWKWAHNKFHHDSLHTRNENFYFDVL